MTETDFFNSLPPDVQLLLAQCQHSTKNLAKVFMKDSFWREFSQPHDEIFHTLDNPENQQLRAILAPRGIGKTSIVSKPYLARNILFRHKKHIVYVSHSFGHARDQTENLKWELQNNAYFSKLFGDIQPADDGDRFAIDSWVTSTGTRVVPKGSGQQVRGLLYRSRRPDLIVVDDLEDPQEALSEEQRAKQWTWFNSDLLHAIDRGSDDWEIVVIGTVVHQKSLLARLLKDEAWSVKKLQIRDANRQSLWPEFMSTEAIEKLYQQLKARGEADSFSREYMNDAISESDATFKRTMFQYYSEKEEQLTGRQEIINVILVDPAKTANPRSDYSAVVVVAIDRYRGRLFVRDLSMQRQLPDEMFEVIYNFKMRYHARIVGIEVTSLHEHLLQPFKNYMATKRAQFELIELKPRGSAKVVEKKEHRIGGLSSYYKQGQIYHNSNGAITPLEDQLLSFPVGDYDDAADALAYITQLMELGGIYFVAADQSYGDEPESVYEALEKEFDEEEIPDSDWMIA